MAAKSTTLDNLTAAERDCLIKLLKKDTYRRPKGEAPGILAKMGVEFKPEQDLVKGMKGAKVALYPRAELIEYYRKGAECCEDPCEREYFMGIVEALEEGETDITDKL